jgi:hypothetical protein
VELIVFRAGLPKEEVLKQFKDDFDKLKDKEDIKLLIDIETSHFDYELYSKLHASIENKLLKVAIVCDEKLFIELIRNSYRLKPVPNIFSTSLQAEKWLMKE